RTPPPPRGVSVRSRLARHAPSLLEGVQDLLLVRGPVPAVDGRLVLTEVELADEDARARQDEPHERENPTEEEHDAADHAEPGERREDGPGHELVRPRVPEAVREDGRE